MVVEELCHIEVIDKINHFAERAMDMLRIIADQRHCQANALECVKVLDLGDGDVKGILDALRNFAHDAAFAFEAIIAVQTQLDGTHANNHGLSCAPPASSPPAHAQT